MLEDALPLTLPEVLAPRTIAPMLWKAMDSLRNSGTAIGTLRNLILGIIYLRTVDESFSEFLPATPASTEYALQKITSELRKREITITEVEHIDPEIVCELLYAVEVLVRNAGPAESFRIVLETTTGARGNYVTPRSVVAAMINSVDIPPGGVVYAIQRVVRESC